MERITIPITIETKNKLNFIEEMELDACIASELFKKGYMVLDSTQYNPTGERNQYEYNLILEAETSFEDVQETEIDRIISDAVCDNGYAVVEIGEYEYVPVA